MLKGPPSGLDQQTSEWRVNDGHDAEHYVVLVIERAGSWPGAHYAHFVQRRAGEINDQLVLVKQLAAQADTQTIVATQRIYHLELPPQLDQDQDQEQEDDESVASLPSSSSKKRSAAASGNRRGGRPKTGPVGLGTGGRKPRQLEKTHLFVCTNPFALMDELNADTGNTAPSERRMHYFLSVVTGKFQHRWMAERYCDAWGASSRGAGPRASWGDALKTVHGFDMWVDIGIVFDHAYLGSNNESGAVQAM
jgi:hypothetical protein